MTTRAAGPVAFTMASLAVLAAACFLGPADHPDFGTEYRLYSVISPLPLSDNQFTVSLVYAGCGPDEFTVSHRLGDRTAELWLRRRDHARNELCDMEVAEERTFLVPEPVRAASPLVLLGPDGGRFPLRS